MARGKVDSDPDALFAMLREQTLCPERIVLETGSMSNWLTAGLLEKNMPVSCVWKPNPVEHHDEAASDLRMTDFGDNHEPASENKKQKAKRA